YTLLMPTPETGPENTNSDPCGHKFMPWVYRGFPDPHYPSPAFYGS
ncbi:unnamed protein product, partial [marine sediment metagenome]